MSVTSERLEMLERKRWQETLEAMESVAKGRVVSGDRVVEWLQSWGKPDELSVPSSPLKNPPSPRLLRLGEPVQPAAAARWRNRPAGWKYRHPTRMEAVSRLKTCKSAEIPPFCRLLGVPTP